MPEKRALCLFCGCWFMVDGSRPGYGLELIAGSCGHWLCFWASRLYGAEKVAVATMALMVGARDA